MAAVELPYHEALARLYELRALIDTYEAAELDELDPMPEGRCIDCAQHRPRVRYGRVAICRTCATSRIRVRNGLSLRAAAAGAQPDDQDSR
jgi:hypothetical protein